MKNPAKQPGPGMLRAALITGVILGGQGCQLPPRETWARIQSQGLIPVLMTPSPAAAPSPAADQPVMVARVPRSAEPPSRENPPPTPPKIEGPPPYAAVVADRPGFVYSPFTTTKKQIDVRTFRAGQAVRCPYSLSPFRVPAAALAHVSEADRGAPLPRPRAVPAPSRRELAARPLPDRTPKPPLPVIDLVPAPGPEPVARVIPEPAAAAAVPYGSRIPGRPGFVNSPHAQKHQLVDVTGIASGVEVKCPYTDKPFRVPAPAEGIGDAFAVPAAEPAPAAAPPTPPAPTPTSETAPEVQPVPLQESPAVKELTPPGD